MKQIGFGRDLLREKRLLVSSHDFNSLPVVILHYPLDHFMAWSDSTHSGVLSITAGQRVIVEMYNSGATDEAGSGVPMEL